MNGAEATPDTFVATVIVAVLLLNLPDAPEPGAVKVTFAPLTGVLEESRTVATSGAAKAVLIVALCGVPLVAAMVAGTPATPAEKVRWKLVVPPSPRKEETMKKYVVPLVAAKDTCDCAIPEAASLLHATSAKVPGAPVTAVKIVSYGLVSVSATIVPLLGAVNLNHTLLPWPLAARPGAPTVQDGTGSAAPVLAVA